MNDQQANLCAYLSKYGNKNFDNAPTYRQLLEQLQLLSDEQLDVKVTIELDLEGECIPGCLDIAGETHDSLDEGVPVIRCCW